MRLIPNELTCECDVRNGDILQALEDDSEGEEEAEAEEEEENEVAVAEVDWEQLRKDRSKNSTRYIKKFIVPSADVEYLVELATCIGEIRRHHCTHPPQREQRGEYPIHLRIMQTVS